MKKTAVIILFLIVSYISLAQGVFKTILSADRVIEGESFRVQYVVQDASVISNFISPEFRQFRLISGPDIYMGELSNLGNLKQSKNFVFTLVALKPGRFIIPGATINIDGKIIKSKDLILDVISKESNSKGFEKESLSDYFLRPGEDVQQKIKENLFLKVLLDKKSCFVGEPVLATFKLYSRLESKSDIVKNPGFYGFSVYDMVNLTDKVLTVEKINGKPFDVHTVRKVQLYPLRAGIFIIESMEVKNKVEFSRSLVNKKTEQEISEGILNSKKKIINSGTEVFESETNTPPVTIKVKPVSEKNKPPDYHGAVGSFSISAAIAKNEFYKNEEGLLEIKIRGSGNFIQLNAPTIQWPQGIEGFEPTLNDSLNKYQSPLTGQRVFLYPFVADSTGQFSIPAVDFSFFNPVNGSFNTVSTKPVSLTINEKIKISSPVSEVKKVRKNSNPQVVLLICSLIILFGGIFIYLIFLTYRKAEVVIIPDKIQNVNVTEDVLSSAAIHVNADDKDFYTSLQKGIWKFMTNRFKISGSEMNKSYLFTQMLKAGLSESIINETAEILFHCENGIYTNASPGIDKKTILLKSGEVLKQINQSLL